MRLVVERDNFIKVLSLVNQVVELRPNLPVLNNFLFLVEQGRLEITATNLETTLKYRLPVKVEKEGKITMPAKILLDFCQAANGEKVTVLAEKDSATVTIGGASASLPTISPEEFPTVEEFGAEETLEIDKKKWLESISEVVFCAAPEGGRPILSGVLLITDGKNLNIVATDGYRLAKKELPLKGSFEAVAPTRALQTGVKILLEQEDETVELSVDKNKNQLQIKTKDMSVTTRLLSGDYPNYQQIIPSSFVANIELPTKEFSGAIKLAALFAREVGNVVRLGVEDRTIAVSASTAQVGEAKTSVEAKVEGEKMNVAFNSRFLLESVSAVKTERIVVSLSGPTSAALIRSLGSENLVYVVMPVRIQS